MSSVIRVSGAGTTRAPGVAARGRSSVAEAARMFRRSGSALFGLGLVVVLGTAAVLAPLLAPHDPNLIDTARRLARPLTPGHPLGTQSARHIPADVKREVHERDEDRCTFVSENGKRCDSRRMVEFEHDVPRARGGESTPENLRLLCRAHNQLMAEREFGTEFMDRKRAARGRRGPRHETNVRDAATGEPL